MFSKEIQLEAVEMYLKGVSTGEIRKKFGIKGSATLGIWVKSIKQMAFTASKIYIDRRQGIHIPLKSR
ncbi:transposase [Weissella confusa]|uniref:transposase n=1 Tax=Weissella confusa TaxID=1583 RepID=UPI0022E4D9E1|nr:transposase [Weissella confusa]